jgi:hypothetical protein
MEITVTPNMELVDQVFEEIRKDLSRWNQFSWTTNVDPYENVISCRTAFCFGGWALYLNNRLVVDGDDGYIHAVDVNGVPVPLFMEAARLLGFNDALAVKVFYNMNSDFESFQMQVREDIERMGALTLAQVDAWP